VAAFEDIGRSIETHTDRDRIALALRWMDQANRTDGVDAIVKAWTALETLSMPNTTNIRPMNDALSRMYGISSKEANTEFLTGHLQGLRSDVVHNGHVTPVGTIVGVYMHELFKDLLFERLGLEHLARAKKFLESNGEQVRRRLLTALRLMSPVCPRSQC
jgi:hypothetical protein